MNPSPATGRWVLAAAILGSSITFIDGTVINVVLPVLQRELDATVAAAQWIVESYALMLAALILVGGSLGDRLGATASSAPAFCSLGWRPYGADLRPTSIS